MQPKKPPQPQRDTAWSAVGMDWFRFAHLAGGLVHSAHRDRMWEVQAEVQRRLTQQEKE